MKEIVHFHIKIFSFEFACIFKKIVLSLHVFSELSIPISNPNLLGFSDLELKYIKIYENIKKCIYPYLQIMVLR